MSRMRRLLVILLPLLAACSSFAPDDESYTRVRTSERGRYGEELGTYSVGSIPDVTVRDESRQRDVRFTIDYPINVTAAQPLILVTPEEGMTNRGYVGLAAYWTSFGYNVVRLASSDPRDAAFVLDSLDRIERDYPELAGKIDRTKIGAAGHAAGSAAAMQIGATDPRIKAVVAMGPGAAPATALRVPTMYMVGTREAGTDAAYRAAQAGDQWLVTLEGASGMTFGGRNTPPPTERRDEYDPFTGQRRVDPRTTRGQQIFVEERTLFHMVRSISLGFWDLYLRGDAAGREYFGRVDAREDVTIEQR